MFHFFKKSKVEDPEIVYLRNKVRSLSMESNFRNNKITASVTYIHKEESYITNKREFHINAFAKLFEFCQIDFLANNDPKVLHDQASTKVWRISRKSIEYKNKDVSVMTDEEFEEWLIDYKDSLRILLMNYKFCKMLLEVRKHIIDSDVENLDKMIFYKMIENILSMLKRDMDRHSKKYDIVFDTEFSEAELMMVSQVKEAVRLMDEVVLFSFNTNPLLNMYGDKIKYDSMYVTKNKVCFSYNNIETNKTYDYVSGWIKDNTPTTNKNMYTIASMVIVSKYMEFEYQESTKE